MRHDEAEALWARQADVLQDFERLSAAAIDLDGIWTGIRWDEADIVVLVTDPDRVRGDLLARIEHPDRLRIEPARFSRRELDEVYRQVTAELAAGQWNSHGPGFETVDVGLRSTEEALAQRLHDRFGDAVSIRLGRHPYPLRVGREVERSVAPVSTLRVPGLVVTAEPEAKRFSRGATFGGTVRFRNTGDRPIRLGVGAPGVGVLIDADDRVVGGFTGMIAGVERAIDLVPGQSDTVGFVAGSDSDSPAGGATLPPGGYRLVVTTTASVRSEHGPHGRLVSEPLGIELVRHEG